MGGRSKEHTGNESIFQRAYSGQSRRLPSKSEVSGATERLGASGRVDECLAKKTTLGLKSRWLGKVLK